MPEPLHVSAAFEREADAVYRKRAHMSVAFQQDCGTSFSQAWKRVGKAFPWLANDMAFCRELREAWDVRARARLRGESWEIVFRLAD